MCVMLVPSGYGASRIDIHTHISITNNITITIYINININSLICQVCQKVLC